MDNVTKNNSERIDEINQQLVPAHLPILIIILIMLIIGVIGNIFVLIVYKFKLRRSSARVYIISLALADLFVCVVGIPYHTLDKIWIVNYSNSGVCRSLTFLMVSGSFSSVFVLLVVGLDRFFKVCRPLKRQIKDFGDRKACLIAIIIGIIVSIPIFILYGNSTYYREDLGITEINCFVENSQRGSVFALVYLAVYLLIFIVSVVYLVTIYGFICKKIYEHDKMQGAIVLNRRKGCCGCTSAEADDADEEELNEDDNDEDKSVEMKDKSGDDIESTNNKLLSGNGSKRSSKPKAKKPVGHAPSSAMVRHTAGNKKEKNTRKITLMMFTITVVFIIAYLPYIVISILDSIVDYWTDMSQFVALLNDFLLRLYLVNNVANPIIYCFWDKKFRKECVKLLKPLFCRGETNGNDSTKNTSSSSGSSSNTHYTIAK